MGDDMLRRLEKVKSCWPRNERRANKVGRATLMASPRLIINQQREFLYVACDGDSLVNLSASNGKVLDQWPLAGGPDATFFNPASGVVHVAIGDPGVVQTIDPRSGSRSDFVTARGAQTTALAAPDRLYVFSPVHRGAIVLTGA